jgi:hypothetical protein
VESGFLIRNRSDNVHRQVPAYQELWRVFDFFSRWRVIPFDDQAASQFQGLRQQHSRIGTIWLQ